MVRDTLEREEPAPSGLQLFGRRTRKWPRPSSPCALSASRFIRLHVNTGESVSWCAATGVRSHRSLLSGSLARGQAVAPRRGSIAPGGVLVLRPFLAIPQCSGLPFPPCVRLATWRPVCLSERRRSRKESVRLSVGTLSVGRGSSWRAERRNCFGGSPVRRATARGALSRPASRGGETGEEGCSKWHRGREAPTARLVPSCREGEEEEANASSGAGEGQAASSCGLLTGSGGPARKSLPSDEATCRSRSPAPGPRRPPAPRFRPSEPRWPCRCARRCRSRSA